ncbi:MAG: HAMP domain-containing sensor histidine kinase [Bacteroidales bacterium]|nr:HAMP domain-containing sensor histidine kinase [Bacteroidales bacterium]HOK99139.1 HAMP domain-containing sensor histidine kinase [Bacteroidales bacterium]HPO65969.1 HAMP domain-containing sensor histidine kinase [Bacteroidales bacterium]
MSRLTDQELIEELQRRFEENRKTIQELKELTEELKIVNKKLEESEALKSHFISNITNEIINPFTSILGLSRSILSVKKENWKKVISMVALIHSEAFNLDFQLRNIFLAAKIEAGEIYPEILNVDLKNLVKSVIDSFRIEAKKKNLTFEFNFEIVPEKGDIFYFKTDPEKVKLAIANLISNAIKFSYENGKIIVRVWKDDEMVHISVQDFGTGISEANQKIIFDRFKRLDSGINSLNRGHGLGLSINKAVIDLLQGKISIKSEINKGATFTISIPEAKTNIAGFSADGNEFLFDTDEIF